MLVAILSSQIISNVPAAVVLSGFTDQWHQLLAGVNIGGLGTPIASLASLITFREYTAHNPHGAKKYLMLFSLFWKRTTRAGAIAGMVGGAGMVFLWKLVISQLGGVFAIYELLPAFLFSTACIVIVSLMTEAPSKEIEEDFEAVRAGNIEA